MAPVVTKSLSRLSRDSIVDLCLRWTQSSNATPYLAANRNLLEAEEEDYLHEPAENVTALKKLYSDARREDGSKAVLLKRDIIDRIVDGDWRRGFSLQQLADIDFATLEDNDTVLRWSALRLVPFQSTETHTSSHPAKKRKITSSAMRQQHYPTILPATFVANLKSHIAPLVKAHYTLHRLPSPSKLVVLRLYIMPNTPFAPVSANVPRNVKQATDSNRVMYIALPDSCPYVYVSLSGSTSATVGAKPNDKTTVSAKIDMAATKRVILEAIPKALSKPQERWSLENTKLTCRSLKAIGLLRGNSRPGTSGGCYSKFSEEYEWKPTIQVTTIEGSVINIEDNTSKTPTQSEHTPLFITQTPTTPPESDIDPIHESNILTRFGDMTHPSHAKLDRFHITLTNILASPQTSKSAALPPVRKRKRRSLEDIEAGRDGPIEAATNQQPAPITLTFSGVDVFRGLKELALLDGGKYVDLSRMPAWVTGEKGVSGMVV